MNIKHLYIEDFQCYDKSSIDFTQFSSALIVGKIEGSDLHSNGVGKTTIFKAIEYALFNVADTNLEKLIRDDRPSCKVIFCFELDNEEYRICRSRTRKGTSDISLFKRINSDGKAIDIYSSKTSDQFWKDISGRRASDTEKDIGKLFKINSKSFRNIVHFAQNDFSGLTTATPEKRKTILRETLSLIVYSKLEKLAKDKASAIQKQIEKINFAIDTIICQDEQELISDIEKKSKEASVIENKVLEKENVINKINSDIQTINASIQEITNENKSLLLQKDKITKEISKISNSVLDLSKKKNIIIQESKTLATELKAIKENIVEIEKLNFSDIDNLNSLNDNLQVSLKEKQINFQTFSLKIKELQLPLPEGSECKHCRQQLTKQHIDNCKKQIDEEIKDLKFQMLSLEKDIASDSKLSKTYIESIKSLQSKKIELSTLKNSFEFKEKEIKNKKEIFNEYSVLIAELNSKLELEKCDLIEVENKIKESSFNKIFKLNEEVVYLNKNSSNEKEQKNALISELSAKNNLIAVLNDRLSQSKENKNKKDKLCLERKNLQEEYDVFPSVIDSFSSSGIPNLIIQNLLDELQEEANTLLASLKPGLQLQFITEKEKKDTTSDTLDIVYSVNGKTREFGQLSGAMQLCFNFSLKLGMSLLLQKMFDTQVNFLLLDEIDQPLDKAAVDAFADIVKLFQKDFKILVITHNDRLKDKFKHSILVEQDMNMVSRASVMS